MSWQATTWAMNQKVGNAGRKLLLLALANYADENGVCWPSQGRLSLDTEASLTPSSGKRKSSWPMASSRSSDLLSAADNGKPSSIASRCLLRKPGRKAPVNQAA
jgi:hypothetical protein